MSLELKLRPHTQKEDLLLTVGPVSSSWFVRAFLAAQDEDSAHGTEEAIEALWEELEPLDDYPSYL